MYVFQTTIMIRISYILSILRPVAYVQLLNGSDLEVVVRQNPSPVNILYNIS